MAQDLSTILSPPSMGGFMISWLMLNLVNVFGDILSMFIWAFTAIEILINNAINLSTDQEKFLQFTSIGYIFIEIFFLLHSTMQKHTLIHYEHIRGNS